MKFKEYLVEDKLDEMAIKTKKDLTKHSHTGIVDENGDGKTTNTITGVVDTDTTLGVEDHEHMIYQWLVQPAHGHVHNMEE